MLRKIDHYFLHQEEPAKSCLMALRALLLAFHEEVSEAWRYRMPFYFYKGKRIGYLWKDKKTQFPYIGVVDGQLLDFPQLEQGKRSKMKILTIDPLQDLPVVLIHELLQEMIALHEHGPR